MLSTSLLSPLVELPPSLPHKEHLNGCRGSFDLHFTTVLKQDLVGAQVWSSQAVRVLSDLDGTVYGTVKV